VYRAVLEDQELQGDLLHHVHLSAQINQTLPGMENTNHIYGQPICYVNIGTRDKQRAKVKLILCLTNETLYHEDIQRTAYIDPSVGSDWSVSHHCHFTAVKVPWHLSDRSGGPQGLSR
jgi:hypothetical protein